MKGTFKLHRIYFLMFVSVLFLCVSSPLHAQELLNIDFSAAQGYVNDYAVGQPAGASNQWMDLIDTGISGIVAADPYFVENGELVIFQDGSGASWITMAFPAQKTGMLTLTWDWRYVGPAEENIDVGINLSDSANYSLDITTGSLSGWGRQTTTVRMKQDGGVLDCYSTDGYYALAVYPYTDGALISMRYIVNLDKKRFDVHAQKVGEAEVALGLDYGYRRGVSATTGGLDHLSIWVSGSALTECHIDNIVLIASPGSTDISEWSLYK